ncbi:hypothetical protein C6B38_09200 [Spiroplasma sp. ChiS]|uniref:pentapeptide repeat-containing protein n=1 Tax=Spiroplasma sp. ChiS TaxID=2099885 RepID=UPI000CFA772B|nr:pentapeptide repeat-containing protein [Spiroplasma sp. ChiS]PQP77944.1 hypothetical protein C6B38_09200 [Spiroplasma sp. ChiS]
MKTLHEMIKDLTGIDVEQDKISDYLEEEVLYLQGADLRFADLQVPDLRGADLHRADLIGVNLQDACLRGADLSGADLQGIKITKEQLDQLTVIEEDE